MEKEEKEDKWRREEGTEEGKEGKLSQSLFGILLNLLFKSVLNT